MDPKGKTMILVVPNSFNKSYFVDISFKDSKWTFFCDLKFKFTSKNLSKLSFLIYSKTISQVFSVKVESVLLTKNNVSFFISNTIYFSTNWKIPNNRLWQNIVLCLKNFHWKYRQVFWWITAIIVLVSKVFNYEMI